MRTALIYLSLFIGACVISLALQLAFDLQGVVAFLVGVFWGCAAVLLAGKLARR